MDEEELILLVQLKKQALACGYYDIAARLCDAEKLLEKKLRDKWTKDLLNKLDEE